MKKIRYKILRKIVRKLRILVFIVLLIPAFELPTDAQQVGGSKITLPKLSVGVEKGESKDDFVLTLQILGVLTVLTLAPSILVMMTCFTRIIIVFHFLKQALGTQTQPPNQVLTGLALFITFFIMQPVLNQANANGIQPYMREEITQEQAIDNITQPFREFMLKQTREKDLGLFVKLSGSEKPYDAKDISTWTLIPAYTLSEIRIAFQIGFLLFIPFLVLDMIIASTLMSLGMFLLPPQLISLPIKVLLFILVDGWYLIVDSLIKSIIST
ncbi:MAG: Flagellar biosynthetic protein FliP [Bacteroidota bacterium]|nr:Flagellar biosynthetic protein FliP [Bacteroidota bacterium]